MRRRRARRRRSPERLEDGSMRMISGRGLSTRGGLQKKRDILLHKPGVDLLLLGLLF